MPSPAFLSTLDEIAVREQYRRFLFVCLDTCGVDGHYVRPVRKICNTAESLGLALRTIGSIGAVKAVQLGISRRVNDRFDFKREWRIRRLRNRKAVGSRRIIVWGKDGPVKLERDER